MKSEIWVTAHGKPMVFWRANLSVRT